MKEEPAISEITEEEAIQIEEEQKKQKQGNVDNVLCRTFLLITEFV